MGDELTETTLHINISFKMFQQQMRSFGDAHPRLSQREAEQQAFEKKLAEITEDTVEESLTERLEGIFDWVPSSIKNTVTSSFKLSANIANKTKNYGRDFMWCFCCIVVFGAVPNIVLGEQASEKYRNLKSKQAKVYGGGLPGAPGSGSNMQYAR